MKFEDRVVVVKDAIGGYFGCSGDGNLVGRRGTYIGELNDGIFDHEVLLDGETDSTAFGDEEIAPEDAPNDWDSMLCD